MEDNGEIREVLDELCSSQNSTIIYCFVPGTHSYIDGTKDWKRMKKRLRFQLPITPLNVLCGEKMKTMYKISTLRDSSPHPPQLRMKKLMKVLTVTLTDVFYQLMILVKLVKRDGQVFG